MVNKNRGKKVEGSERVGVRTEKEKTMGGGKAEKREGDVVNKASVSMVTSSSRSAKIKLQNTP